MKQIATMSEHSDDESTALLGKVEAEAKAEAEPKVDAGNDVASELETEEGEEEGEAETKPEVELAPLCGDAVSCYVSVYEALKNLEAAGTVLGLSLIHI